MTRPTVDTQELVILSEDENRPELTVTVDQRDQARFELEYRTAFHAGLATMTMTTLRYVGWAAAKRTGAYPHGWEKFNAEAIQVGFTDDDPEAATTEVDPTQPGA